MNLPLNIIYRTYPGYNLDKALKAFPDKKTLVKYSLSSLMDNLAPNNSRLHIIIDAPTDEYILLINDIISNFSIRTYIHIREKPYGNAESFNSCLLLANSFGKSNIFFCEDDYLIHPELFESVNTIFSQTDSPDYLFPFSHPDYSRLLIHKLYRALTYISESSNIYKRRASGCLTFFTSKDVINRDFKILKLYADGFLGDHNMWKLITLPYISSSTIIKELYINKYNKNNSLIRLFASLIKKNRSTVASLNSSLALHLANDCLPIEYESFYRIENPNLLKKEFMN
tara:strand:- start:2888 stop:3742 length:855 start_codon:yes stop_codon:yes gene_type:complete